jgi:hypothetical protein
MSKESLVLLWMVKIGDFAYPIILQSIFMTKKYELKNISTCFSKWTGGVFDHILGAGVWQLLILSAE